jgi:hypothetical protein
MASSAGRTRSSGFAARIAIVVAARIRSVVFIPLL